ncbi:MAG: energy-coupling factor transporter transmembrane protein EcfT [Clostridia bacterium]|nr:energy-coupling factor transporter transmembrane protein EcfT [Clostridia bacterium]
MIKDITFGQYYETKSLVHKLDPRTKIVLLLLLLVFIFLCKNFLSLALLCAFVLSVAIITKIPLKIFFNNIKAILPVVIFTALINLFYSGGDGEILFSVWKLSVTTAGVSRAVFMAIRIVILIFTSSVLTYTTTPNDLTDAMERLLSPLKFIGLGGAVHTVAMMMTIALRFIPTLVEETDKIMSAQKARGADLENGKLLDRIKALIPILIPLLISSVRRAYELAEAMECRCYNGADGRTRMKQLKLSSKDIVCAFLTVLVCVFVLIINKFV